MVLRQQMIGQYRLFRPKNAGKAAHRLTAGNKTREKAGQAAPERNGGNRRQGRARRTNTLRNAKKYSAESTRVLAAEYSRAFRKGLHGFPHSPFPPGGETVAPDRPPLGPQPLLEEERNRTKPAPRTFRRDKKKRRNPQAPTLCPFTRPLPHGNAPEGCSTPSYRSMSTVA